MSADLAERLRSLARDYHEGRIDLRAYRSLRAPLLDSLVLTSASAPTVEITQPRAPAWQSEAITRPGKPGTAPVRAQLTELGSNQVETSPASNPSNRNLLRFGVIAIVIVVVAIATVSLWPSKNTSSSGNSVSDASAGTESDRIRDAVGAFTDRNDWGDGRLTTLNASLLESGGENIALIAHEAGFQRCVDELRRRLKEQQALSSTPLTADTSPLAALAVTVGLDLNSPDAAIHIAALPPPQAASTDTSTEPLSRRGQSTGKATAGADATAASGGSAITLAGSASPTSTATATPTSARATSPSQAPAEAAHLASNLQAMSLPAASSGVTTGSAIRSSSQVSSANTPSSDDPCRTDLVGSRRPLCHDTLPNGTDAPLLALVPAGAFDMGSTSASEEQPVHRVTLREPFAISIYEVSQGEFKQYCEQTGKPCTQQPWTGDDYPVVNVSWDDARAYTEWLSSVTHRRYSLPTEAQWEYAARAGRTGLFPSGDALSPTDAYYSLLNKQTTAARRSQKFNANAFRLVHTLGNVREWVEDSWATNFTGAPADGSAMNAATATMRVVRGGSYTDGAARLRLSLREGLAPATRDTTTGFRIVRDLH
jgi:formylglycine-generating enzyme required for sulfatase activity